MLAKLIALVLPLALETFAVATALGMTRMTPASRRRTTVLFSAFEAGMPLVGLALGASLGRAISSAANYVAVGILIAFGLYALIVSQHDEPTEDDAHLGGLRVLALGASDSLDELAIGFTLGLLRLPIVLVIALIAVQAIIVTQLGLRLGHRLSEQRREQAEKLAGLSLTTLGLILLAERLLG